MLEALDVIRIPLAFVQRVDSHCLFNEAVKYWQAIDAFVIHASDILDFIVYHLSILWASTQLQEHKMKILLKVSNEWALPGIMGPYYPWLMRSSEPYPNDGLDNATMGPVARVC